MDIGRSVSPYDGDSSYFSANTGTRTTDWTKNSSGSWSSDVLCGDCAGAAGGDGGRRPSFLGSSSDVSGEGQEAELVSPSGRMRRNDVL